MPCSIASRTACAVECAPNLRLADMVYRLTVLIEIDSRLGIALIGTPSEIRQSTSVSRGESVIIIQPLSGIRA